MATRLLSTTLRRPSLLRQDFLFYPDFLSIAEQRILLSSALRKLDSLESRASRLRRGAFLKEDTSVDSQVSSGSVEDLFLSDAYYKFEEGHYDGIIKHYREAHVTTWPTTDLENLSPILHRLHSLSPTQDLQTHILHLARDGEILPHVDNISASGTWILGVSLGADRIMRMDDVENEKESFDVLLPSGSVYIQRDSVRYGFRHSILKGGQYQGRELRGGQRISVMFRDRWTPN